MFWIRSGLHSISISDWLTAGPAVAADPCATMDDIREAMLDALGDTATKKRAGLAQKIGDAPDVPTLWELRSELMMAVSQQYGETEGRRRLAGVTARFEGLVPQACALTRPRRGHAIQRRI